MKISVPNSHPYLNLGMAEVACKAENELVELLGVMAPKSK
jgi:hypothetical protein